MTDPRIAAGRPKLSMALLDGFSPFHYFQQEETKAYMDAQDARIKELSERVEELEEAQDGWGENFEGQKKRIAELEREIREAYVLLVDWEEFDHTETWRTMRTEWLIQHERNAEKEQGS
jgi:hypothetical protein